MSQAQVSAIAEIVRSENQSVFRRKMASRAAEQVTTRRRSGAIALGIISIAALMRLRSNYDNPISMWVEVGVMITGLIICRRWVYLSDSNPIAFHSMAAFYVAYPVLLDGIFRRLGSGNGMEIVVMSCLAWGGMLSAICGKRLRLVNLSVVCSGFLTLFTTCISDQSIAAVFAYAYAVICLWWLVANQWERLETCAVSQIEYTKTRGLVAVAIGGLILLVTTWSVAGRIPVLRKLTTELMPTSGGTSQRDSAAHSGVGDGDALIAARNHPSSFGAVETDMFLDSEQPSLFDIFSDEFGEPAKIKKTEQSQALAPKKQVEENEAKAAEANRSGRQSFSTDRVAPNLKDAPKDLLQNALLFWSGPVGVRLAVERFDAFDGIEWQKSEASEVAAEKPSNPTAVPIDDRTWFKPTGRFVHGSLSPFVGATSEAIKFTRYRSPIIPTHSGMQMWCIDDLTREDLFSYTVDDCLVMPGREHVPDYTVVRFIGSEMYLDQIEHLMKNCSPRLPTIVNIVGVEHDLQQLARTYAGDIPRGWKQVSEVVRRVRLEFSLSDSTDSADQSKSPLEKFLHDRKGPSYMFATATAQMLKQLGYETRLAVGFYVNPKQQQFGQRDTSVLASDAHVWVELNAGHDYWLPLEPTPGYRVPQYTASLWYRIVEARVTIALCCCTFFSLAATLYILRRVFAEAIFQSMWLIVARMNDRRRIAWLRWVLDFRLRWAGKSRPAHVPLRNWLIQLIAADVRANVGQIQIVLNESDRLYFGGLAQMSEDGRTALRQAWRALTIQRLLNCQKVLRVLQA
jgi:protein-glutamine gamma-glutamyltransferase